MWSVKTKILFLNIIFIEPYTQGTISLKDKLKFRSVAANIPATWKKEKGGEDAWFNSEKIIAVADGVS